MKYQNSRTSWPYQGLTQEIIDIELTYMIKSKNSMVHTFRGSTSWKTWQHRRSLQVMAYIKGDAKKIDNLWQVVETWNDYIVIKVYK